MLEELKKEIDIDLQNVTWDQLRVKLDTTRQYFLQFLASVKLDAPDSLQKILGYVPTTAKSLETSMRHKPFTLIIATNTPRIEGEPMTDDYDIDIVLSTKEEKSKTTTFTIPARKKLASFNHFEQLSVYKGLILMEDDLLPMIEAFPPSTGA